MGKLLTRSFLLLTATLAFTAMTALAAPPLEVRGATFDFGHVAFGSTVKHRVTMINHSDGLIKITRVNPGCGCTQIPLPKRDIAPGDSVTLELILDTSKIKPGLFHKAPMIFTDNVQSARITVTLTGYNLGAEERGPRIKVDPMTIKLDHPTGEQSFVLHLTNGDARDLRARIVSAPDKQIAVPILPRKLIAAGGRDSIVVTIPRPATANVMLQESLTFSFDDNKETRFTIPITIVN